METRTQLPGTEYPCNYCGGHGTRETKARGPLPCTMCQKKRYPVFRATIRNGDGSASTMLVVGDHGRERVQKKLGNKSGVTVEFERVDP
jgi:hypothetical protein